MEDKKNYEIFPGKTLSNLFEDIYTNSDKTNKQVDNLISELKKYIKSLDHAIAIVPLIREYLDVKVKSDDQLVKLSDTIQRLLKSDKNNESDNSILTEQEKEQLLKDITEQEIFTKSSGDKINELNKEVEKIINAEK